MIIMAIRAVEFDIGDVLRFLLDLDADGPMEAQLGLSPGEIDKRMEDIWMGAGIGTVTLDELHQALRDRLGMDEQQVEAYMADSWRWYVGIPNTELLEYARGLRPRYRTGLLSNGSVGAREREHAAYGYGDIFDEIIYSFEVGLMKPDPRIYVLACARLDVLPEEMVFVDDVEENVAAAREVGIHAVHYRDNAQVIEEINKLLTTL
jgi:epoxide hydrolase-like predicted phosphatase